jgi:hypothetical protein
MQQVECCELGHHRNNPRGWRAAVRNTVKESPNVIFRDHMNGGCNIKKVTFEGDRKSDSSFELATGQLRHEVPPAKAEGSVQNLLYHSNQRTFLLMQMMTVLQKHM